MLVINESGMYSLTLTSRKDEAKRFKKWVTSEVLPSIRKTGSYSSYNVVAIPNFSNPASTDLRGWNDAGCCHVSNGISGYPQEVSGLFNAECFHFTASCSVAML